MPQLTADNIEQIVRLAVAPVAQKIAETDAARESRHAEHHKELISKIEDAGIKSDAHDKECDDHRAATDGRIKKLEADQKKAMSVYAIIATGVGTASGVVWTYAWGWIKKKLFGH